MITDTHAHVAWESFDSDLEQVLARAREAGVERMIVVGTTPATSSAASEDCRGRPGLHPTAGIHPHDASSADGAARGAIERLARERACVAIGETAPYLMAVLAARDAGAVVALLSSGAGAERSATTRCRITRPPFGQAARKPRRRTPESLRARNPRAPSKRLSGSGQSSRAW